MAEEEPKSRRKKPGTFDKENALWMQRAKHGKDKIFSDPKILYDCANDYFQWMETHPLFEQDYRNGRYIKLEKKRPFTIGGLAVFLGVSSDYLNALRHRVAKSSDPTDSGYSEVLSYIYEVVKQQKFEGAASGFFNGNLIARDLQLQDHLDVTTKGDSIKNELTDEQINERLNKLIGIKSEAKD